MLNVREERIIKEMEEQMALLLIKKADQYYEDLINNTKDVDREEAECWSNDYSCKIDVLNDLAKEMDLGIKLEDRVYGHLEED